MEFGLSEDQRLLAESVARWAEGQMPEERLKSAADTHRVADPELIASLAELGAYGVLVPEEHGGLGLGLLEAALIQEQLGRNAVPVPFTATAVIAPLALAAADAEVQARWLTAIAGGEARLGAGLMEQRGARDGAGIDRDGDRASGSALAVFDLEGADGALLTTRSDDLILVERDAMAITPLQSIDRTRSLARVDLDGAAATLISGADPALIDDLRAAGRVALAADTLGAAQRMLERAVAYAMERRQFDRVIASFQAVKHLCAEMAADLEPCRALIWYAAHAHAAFPEEFGLMACHAKAHVGEVGTAVARTATEVHGGMGFTHEMGLHYFFKRIGLDRQLLGNPDSARRDAARLQGWAA